MATLLLDIGGTFVKYAYLKDDKFEYGSFPVYEKIEEENLPLALTNFLRKFSGINEIGVSAPGPFDFKKGIGLMKQKLLSIYNVSLLKIFKKYNPDVKVTFIHDAVAFMLGIIDEDRFLINKKVACIMIGTGLGFAYSENGKVLVNKDEITAPELGFRPYKDDIVENYISATALLKFGKEINPKVNSVKEMSELARNGDNKMLGIFNKVGEMLGEVISSVSKEFPFEVLYIGGGVSKSFDLMMTGFKKYTNIKTIVIDDPTRIPIRGVYYALKKGKNNIYL